MMVSGFNVNQVQGEPDGHLGLRLMEDLATNAGAKVEVQSVPKSRHHG